MEGYGNEGYQSVNKRARKAELDRERNRLNSRNTRLKKKHYVDSLKSKVESLTQKKEELLRNRAENSKREADQLKEWQKRLQDVLSMRSNGVTDEKKWATFVTEDFKMSLPLTPYMSYIPSPKNKRCVLGIKVMCKEAASMKVLCQSLSKDPTHESLEMNFELKDFHFFLNAKKFMCKFICTSGPMCTNDKLTYRVRFEGMMRAAFHSEGKLEELELIYDPTSLFNQVLKVSSFFLKEVPYSVRQTESFGCHSAVTLKGSFPFEIVHANEKFQEMVGLAKFECFDRTLSDLLKVSDGNFVSLLESAAKGFARLYANQTLLIFCFPICTEISVGGSVSNVFCVVRRK